MSCHWTTPQWGYIVARAFQESGPGQAKLVRRFFAGRRCPPGGRRAGKNAVIQRFCNHACTLSGRVRRTWRNIGALLSVALGLLMGAIGPGAADARAAALAERASDRCAGATLRPSAANSAAVDAATACLINDVRAAYRLRPLHVNRYLRRVAAGQVSEMVRRNYFADVGPSGQTPGKLIASSRYAVRAASLSTGQNIGWATGAYSTPANMVATWMDSPPHRAVILAGNFHDIGVGVAPTLPSVLLHGRLGAIYAVEFGARWL